MRRPTEISALANRLRLAVALLALAALACGPGGAPTAIVVPPTEEFGGPEFAAIVISSDLAIGEDNRFSFGVINREGMPVRAPEAQLRTFFWPEGEEQRQPRHSTVAAFQEWTTTAAGIFLADLEFDVPGLWEMEADVSTEGRTITAASKFTVKETSDTPNVGDPAPASVTPTAADVDDLSHITSDPAPDPGYYQLSVHRALEQGMPFVVVFASPAWCLTATCGPQLEALRDVRDRYTGRAAFIHVEVFRDPHLIEGARPLGSGALVETVTEWGLPTEPWTFVVDAQGRVAAKYEQFTPASTIEAALQAAMD